MKKIELLAPAGGVKQFKAAVENGADAIYFGGMNFNARMKADNIKDEDLPQLLAYAHKGGVRVYCTINTLLFDEELEEALNYASFLYSVGVDALIIQDLGLGYLIKKEMPDFELHLSTQATVRDLQGVKVAEKLGYERVVLARENTLAEIEEICKGAKAEIECFVHGALCICYSGQCQLSRNMGGRSGNRGLCAQPCRLEYEDDKGNLSHILSPKDLCLIDHLGEYIEAGVASLKIEGRMKSPEYVAVVTKIYRKYIDQYYEKGYYTVSPEDREALNQIYNRGGFTEGYLNGDPGDKLMAFDVPKHQGILIGQVQGVKKGSSLVDIQCENIELGDGIEIHNQKAISGNVLSYVKAIAPNIYRVGDIKGPVSISDKVYRTSSKKQLKEARASFERATRKSLVEARFTFKKGEAPLCQLKLLENNYLRNEVEFEFKGDFIVEEALNKALDRDELLNKLNKTGDSPFAFASLELELEADAFAPMSKINEFRRTALSALEEKAFPSEKRELKKYKVKPCEDHIYNDIEGVDNIGEIGEGAVAGPGLNVCNHYSAKQLYQLGCIKVCQGKELLGAEDMPLMELKHSVDSKYIVDRKGIKYNILTGDINFLVKAKE
ncbi:MAG: U32 family peptidase [Clostridia bacterium]|nr:U32 family peptidase [Clostridia bacterium]